MSKVRHFGIATWKNERYSDFLRRIANEIDKLEKNTDVIDIMFNLGAQNKQKTASIYFRATHRSQEGFEINQISYDVTSNSNKEFLEVIAEKLSSLPEKYENLIDISVQLDEESLKNRGNINIYYD